MIRFYWLAIGVVMLMLWTWGVYQTYIKKWRQKK